MWRRRCGSPPPSFPAALCDKNVPPPPPPPCCPPLNPPAFSTASTNECTAPISFARASSSSPRVAHFEGLPSVHAFVVVPSWSAVTAFLNSNPTPRKKSAHSFSSLERSKKVAASTRSSFTSRGGCAFATPRPPPPTKKRRCTRVDGTDDSL